MSRPESKPSREGTFALIVVGIGIVVLILVVVAMAGFGLFVTASDSAGAGPVQAVEESATVRETLPEGETFGFIVEVVDRHLEFDPARLLTGADATDAAAADGVALETDFYIDNPVEDSTLVPVVDQASVTVLTVDGSGAITESETTLAGLASALSGDEGSPEIYGEVAEQFPATVTVEDGQIVAVEQIYLP